MNHKDIEQMLSDCIPGGSVCDPQLVADAIREWFANRPHRDTNTALSSLIAAVRSYRHEEAFDLVDLEKAADEAERALSGGGWLPIASAPKDGTTILLAYADGVTAGGWISDVDHGAEWEGQLGMAGFWSIDGWNGRPTHWLPLPPAPAGEGVE